MLCSLQPPAAGCSRSRRTGTVGFSDPPGAFALARVIAPSHANGSFLQQVWRLSPTRHGAGLHLFDPADSYAEQLLRARLPRATLETVTPCCAGISSAPQIPGT